MQDCSPVVPLWVNLQRSDQTVSFQRANPRPVDAPGDSWSVMPAFVGSLLHGILKIAG